MIMTTGRKEKTDLLRWLAIKLRHTLLNQINGPFKFYDEKETLKEAGNYSNG
jgi:hypothetical protein